MYLKRFYGPPATEGDPPRVIGVKMLRAGRVQHFSAGFLDGGQGEGWLIRTADAVTIRATTGPVVYRLIRGPGAYCCYCEAAIPDAGTLLEPGLTIGRKHVLSQHGDALSPDPTNPAGYRVEHHYTGVLVGDTVEATTPEEAAQMERGVRDALAVKLRTKYGDTRGASAARRALKTAAAGGEG